jgi:fructose-6-phosphate aldolase 2
MKILLDTANMKTITGIMPYFNISGFTNNPSILAKEGGDIKETLLKLRELAGNDKSIHTQITATDTNGMVEQAKKLQDFFGSNFYAKLPITLEGLRAVPLCKAAGVKCTVTAVFTPLQALMAGLAGADYVAPYVDRLDNITSHGVHVVSEIVKLLELYNLKTQVLAASFKNVQQIYEVASTGAHASTLNGELCMKLLFHPYTDRSVEDFKSDWKGKFGDAEITDFTGP